MSDHQSLYHLFMREEIYINLYVIVTKIWCMGGELDPVCVPLHDGRDVRLMGTVCMDTVNCRGGIHGRSAISVAAASTEPPAASIARARTLGPRCEWRRDKEVFSV